MKEKKHIDTLFKEQFKNFEASPSPDVWKKIQAKLKEEEEDRKVIPLWWKFAGVAALLALLFTIGTTLINSSDSNNPVSTEENTAPVPSESENAKDSSIHDYINKTDVASEEYQPPSSNDPSEAASEKNPDNPKKEKTRNNENSKTRMASSSEKKSSIQKSDSKLNLEKAVADTPKANESIAKTNPEVDANKNTTLIKRGETLEETAKITKVETEKAQEKQNVTDAKKEESEAGVAQNDADANKPSLLDAINEKNEEATVVKTTVGPKERWDVTPNFAPVYYSSLTEGSSIDPTFTDNSKSGDVNLSYGVQVSYNITDRLSVRSGISNVDLSYTTTGLEIGIAPVSAALKTVNYGDKPRVVTVLDKGTIAAQSQGNGPFGNITPKSTQGELELVQNITYYEMPMELKYAVLNNKFGVNLIGGFSTLFLGNNDVSVQALDYSETLGEANNLSTVSFTTNVGIGFDYKISNKLKINVEPMFKYQLNPYTDSSVNFSPYYMGIYSGLSFKF